MTQEEVIILVHQSALEEMEHREVRMIRQLRTIQEDLDGLRAAIRIKKKALSAARDKLLSRCV